MNENFTNISYVDEEDEAANDIDGVETASLDAQVAQLTTKQPDSDLLAAIAQDLDVREKTGSAISDGLAGILTSLLKDKLADEKIQSKIDKYPRPSNVEVVLIILSGTSSLLKSGHKTPKCKSHKMHSLHL